VPWGRLSLWKWIPGISPGIKAAGVFGWRPTTIVVPKRQEIRGLNLLGHLGLTRETFTFYCILWKLMRGLFRPKNK